MSWSAFARCLVCGVAAGEACRDDDDDVAEVVCRGRQVAEEEPMRCFWCTTVVPAVRGRSPAHRYLCCGEPACRRVVKHMYRRDEKLARLSAAATKPARTGPRTVAHRASRLRP